MNNTENIELKILKWNLFKYSIFTNETEIYEHNKISIIMAVTLLKKIEKREKLNEFTGIYFNDSIV